MLDALEAFCLPRRVACAVCALSILVAACGADAPEPMPEPDPYVTTPSPMESLTAADYGGLDSAEIGLNTPWTRNRVSSSAVPDSVVQLTGVSIEQHDGFDRVVFTFDAEVPAFRLVLGSDGGGGAGCDGSGAEPDTPAHLVVEFTGATAGDGVSGQGAVSELPVLASADQTCDADGTVRWLLSMASDTDFRMLEMRGEPRLVVDFRHPEG